MAYTKVNYVDTLRLGVQSDPVCDVQKFCNYGAAYGTHGLTVDGKFGGATENSVKIFQKYAGLTIDGIVGPVNWRTMIENGALGIPGLKREGVLTMDPLVLTTQQWLNETYGTNPAFGYVTEDGATGWGTIRALTRALQIELGIGVDGAFGDGALSTLRAQVGTIGASSERRYVSLVQAALPCKGYSNGGSIDGLWGPGTAGGVDEMLTDAGLSTSTGVEPRVMRALLSMDAYVLTAGGTTEHDGFITDISNSLGIKKAFIQTCLAWECAHMDRRDQVNAIVRTYHTNRLQGLEIPVDAFRDASTGLCQIEAETAIITQSYLHEYGLWYGAVLNPISDDSIREVWQRLNSDEEHNLMSAGLVIAGTARDTHLQLSDRSECDLSEVEAALARYNGTGDAAQAYGARNVELFSIFDAYNSRTRA